MDLTLKLVPLGLTLAIRKHQKEQKRLEKLRQEKLEQLKQKQLEELEQLKQKQLEQREQLDQKQREQLDQLKLEQLGELEQLERPEGQKLEHLEQLELEQLEQPELDQLESHSSLPRDIRRAPDIEPKYRYSPEQERLPLDLPHNSVHKFYFLGGQFNNRLKALDSNEEAIPIIGSNTPEEEQDTSD